ncbi:hypothetical protein SCHPADRAFT_946195 [Schizopora paradoxa]|uniref:Uncharacterized protein n=1 Tax=Schizopora paradoxa TaxID=27342 RepID=A0A0H2R4M7_9AGAM|nr:hypothetical protein SCHPADRAFT_946195 [Schizopora paradoxa]
MARKRTPSEKAVAAQKQKDAAIVQATAPKRKVGRPRKGSLVATRPPPFFLNEGEVDQDSVEIIPPKPKQRARSQTVGNAQRNTVKIKTEPKAAEKAKKAKTTRKKKKESPPPYSSSDEDAEQTKNAAQAEDTLDLDFEPTDDFLAGALNDGIADGTIVISDDDFVPGEEYEEEDDSNNLLAAVTSTPFVTRRKPTKKPAPSKIAKPIVEDDEDKVYEVKIDVHDGIALRPVTISSNDTLLSVLTKVAEKMCRENADVQMCYLAPWSAKEGTKRVPSYVTNVTELDAFWSEYRLHARKKKGEEITGIVFRNRREIAAEVNRAAAKGAGKTKKQPTEGKGTGGNDPKTSAMDKVTIATQEIGVGMRCPRSHDRLCYLTFDGSCRTYTNEHVKEHAALLAAGAPGVVANKVPPTMKSKLLDYFRPGKDARAVARAPTDRDAEQAEAEAAIAAAAATAAPAVVPTAAPAVVPTAVPAVVPAAVPVTAPAEVVMPLAQPAPPSGPLDYPSIKRWMMFCEDDFERGRDKHDYGQLLPIFMANGCTRVDDVARLSVEIIQKLAEKAGIEVSLGLANRVHEYAVEDAALVKRYGFLPALEKKKIP